MASHDIKGYQAIQRREVPGTGPLRQYTQLQLHFLSRLERLIALKNTYESGPSRDQHLRNAVDRVIYSTLRDCIEAGVGEEARGLVRGDHQTN